MTKIAWIFVALLISIPFGLNRTYAENYTVRPLDGLNARSGPGANFQKVEKLSHNTQLKELERSGKWSKVRTPDDSEVWVHNGYLNKVELVSPQKLLDEIREKYNVVGMGVGILKDGKFYEFVSGLRQIDRPNNPIQQGDIWHFASAGKSMTAILIAQFIESGKLDWNSTMKDIFPAISQGAKDSYFASITVEQLLSHTSGLFKHNERKIPKSIRNELFSNRGIRNSMPDRIKILKEISNIKLKHNPGNKYHYSNYNYIILSAIIDAIAKRPWEEILKENILSKIDPDSSCGFGAPGLNRENIRQFPWQHDYGSGYLRAYRPSIKVGLAPYYSGAGRIHCSIRSWVRYLTVWMNGINLKKSEFLSQGSFEKLQTVGKSQYTYGAWHIMHNLNWSQNRVFRHSGTNTYSQAYVAMIPKEDSAFVVTVNQGDYRDKKKNASRALIEMHEALLSKNLLLME